jgi:hypothetical protein
MEKPIENLILNFGSSIKESEEVFLPVLWIRIRPDPKILPVRIQNNHSGSGSEIKRKDKCPHRLSVKLNI